MLHLDQSSIFQGLCDCLVVSIQKRSDDFSQRHQFGFVDVLSLVLGESEQKYGSIGEESDDHTKAASLALSRSGNTLLDDLTAKVSVDQTPYSSFNGIHEAIITDAVLLRKLRECFGLEDSHFTSLAL
jgi:hypothetical protein